MALSRGGFSAYLNAHASFWFGTLRTFTTQSPSSAKTRVPPRCGPSLAPANKSTHAPGSRCAPVTKCSWRSRALITLPLLRCSPGSVPTCPVHHVRINRDVWDQICWLSLMLPSAPGSPVADSASVHTALEKSHVAIRTVCRPLVTTMIDHFRVAFGTPSQPIVAECGTRTDEASHALSLPLQSRTRRRGG